MKFKITYSDRDKFIWFQVNKSASSSIYHVLVENTKLVPNKDYFKHIDFLNKKKKHPELNKYSPTARFPSNLVNLVRPLYEHRVDSKTFNSLKARESHFSFSFVRNPWSIMQDFKMMKDSKKTLKTRRHLASV